MEKIVKCHKCGKRRKTSSGAHYAYSKKSTKFKDCTLMKNNMGKWECVNGYGCSG
jgi:hypothetical protein